jgi:hypothetical protein
MRPPERVVGVPIASSPESISSGSTGDEGEGVVAAAAR